MLEPRISRAQRPLSSDETQLATAGLSLFAIRSRQLARQDAAARRGLSFAISRKRNFPLKPFAGPKLIALIVADRDFGDDQVLTCRDPSDPEAQVGRISAAPLPEVGDAFESLSRLRKLEHRVVVVNRMSAGLVLAHVVPVPPHLLEQSRLIEHRTSRTLP
jgi:hypothetical protein